MRPPKSAPPQTRSRSKSPPAPRRDRPRAESVVAGIAFIVAVGVSSAVATAMGGAAERWLSRSAAFVGLGAMAITYRLLDRRSPWDGPAWLRGRPAYQRWSAAERGRNGGRWGLVAAGVGLALLLLGLSVQAWEQAMISHLGTHGLRTDAQAAGDFGDIHAESAVRFTVRDQIQVRRLQIQDTVPSDPKRGDTLQVVYDSADPSHVLLVSQLTRPHTWNYGIVGFGGLLALAGSGWWLRRRRTSERAIRAGEVEPATDLRVGVDGKLPRERRRG